MTIWYVARGAGLAALVLLTAATALGAIMSGRIPASPTARVVMQYVHRSVATTALAVLGLHLSMILADSFAHVGIVGALVPFQSAYRALWVGLGTLAAYSFVLVASTGFLRRRMASSPRAARLWRVIHASAYAGWGMAMLHGLRSGTDTSVPWVRWLYVACGAAVATSIALRAVGGSGQRVVVRPAQHLAVSR